MPNNKSPGNDGITKEFYEAFWDDLKTPLLLSVNKAFKVGELSTSQKQAVIKLIEKKDKDKRLIKNWRPISLLNVDTKLVSKVLAERLKTALPSLISSNKTAYLNGRFISEGGRLIQGGRLISDISEISDLLKLKGLLLTVDIEKAFDSANHNFLLKVLENYGLSHDFLKWISILLQNQESCDINGGKTTRYFPLKRGTRQGNPISAYRFIFVLEIVFIFVKESENVQGLTIFNNQFLYTTYADDNTFFLSDENSVTEVIQIFEHFSIFSGLKPNKSKCEVAGIGVLKEVQMELCGMECVN